MVSGSAINHSQHSYQLSTESLLAEEWRISIHVHISLVSLLFLGYEFPVDFIPMVRRIFRTYFAILAHIYHHHFHDIRALDLHDGLNSLFLHFVYFVQEFSLVEAKEMQCLEDLIQKLIQLDQDMAKCPNADDFIDAGKVSSQQPEQKLNSDQSS